MISNNYFNNKENEINKNNNNVSFADFSESAQYTISKKPALLFTSQTKLKIEEQIEIDTELCQLSSRKLWQILKLNQVKGCELEQEFLQQVQQELVIRDDFDNGEAWNDPH
jgi:hypothetical protein